MRKHIRFLRFIAFILVMGILYTLFRAYETGWFFNLSVGNLFLLALGISTAVYLVLTLISKLFPPKDQK